MKFIDYNNMEEFYTIPEVLRLFDVDKAKLKKYAERYEIEPVEDQFGNHGFSKYQVRKLHNYIYQEERDANPSKGYSTSKRDPWA